MGAIPRVSVVMAVRDGAPSVAKALDSVLRQEFPDFELLVIDDGSRDQTADIVQTRRDPRVKLVVRPPVGLTPALRFGVEIARGDLIARQDADDESLPGRLATQVEYLDRNLETVMVGTGVEAFDDSGNVIGRYLYPESHEEIRRWLLGIRNPLPHTSICFRRKPVIACGSYREAFAKAQDFDLHLRLSEAHRVASIPKILCRLRQSPRTTTYSSTGGNQFRFAVLALACAEVRRAGRRDPLDGPQRQDFLRRFDEWYPQSGYPKVFESRLTRRDTRVAIADGRWLEAISGACRAVSLGKDSIADWLAIGDLSASLRHWAMAQVSE